MGVEAADPGNDDLETLFFGPGVAVGAEAAAPSSDLEDLFLEHSGVVEPGVDQEDAEAFFFGDGDDAEAFFFGDGADVARRSRKLPEGVVWRSPAHGSLANSFRKCRASGGDDDSDSAALRDAWNLIPRRHGDLVGPCTKGMWTHPNTVTVQNLIKSAFKEIGKGVHTLRGEVAVDSSSRGLDDVIAVAGVARRVFETGGQNLYDELKSSRPLGIALMRNYDGTPIFAKFGKMGATLARHARYPKKVEPVAGQPGQYARWTTVSYAEYCKDHPRRSPEMGVVELFGAQMELAVGESTDGVVRQNFLIPPHVLQNGKSSTMYSALDSMCKPLSVANLIEVSKVVGCAIVQDTPDNCNAMKRLKKKYSHDFADAPNILYEGADGCCIHWLNNFIVNIMGEKQVVGIYMLHKVSWLSINDGRNSLERSDTLWTRSLRFIPASHQLSTQSTLQLF